MAYLFVNIIACVWHLTEELLKCPKKIKILENAKFNFENKMKEKCSQIA